MLLCHDPLDGEWPATERKSWSTKYKERGDVRRGSHLLLESAGAIRPSRRAAAAATAAAAAAAILSRVHVRGEYHEEDRARRRESH